ncbi:septation protein SepH [Corynebacterium uterequi]|uniref:Putative DUF3071 family protein n=1 Tax=Corynebacterium uterequi TaxID=1072256 RepID=A0A0G3HBA3_9CORY|nr:septation protein SepH [Corynebacterium uterequi]AKK10651.1 putative DUF3071 family protein [Corynebacterium uterequi]
MRDVQLNAEDSTASCLVFTDDAGERFSLTISDEVRAALRRVFNEPGAASSSAPTGSSSTLPLRPRDIQARIRAGASAEELAESMGVAPARIANYAHPVLLERKQMAELAKASHPVRGDVPATLTLSETLATAFGARGLPFHSATWTATKQPQGPWVVTVSWHAGLSDNEASWTLERSGTGMHAHARNAVAADLIDPDFVQPVRSLTSIGRGVRYDEPMPAKANSDPGAKDQPSSAHDGELDGEELATTPEPTAPSSRGGGRTRKSTTPRWEDVLLGVRSNAKRPHR